MLYTENDTLAQLLIERGADVNAVSRWGYTSLQRSVNLGNENLVQILLENGANVNATNDYDDSALIIAALNSKHYFTS